MNKIVIILLTTIVLLSFVFIVSWARWSISNSRKNTPSFFEVGVGFVTNFFDTLGIGSYAPTTAIIKFGKSFSDELLPGTLNIGHCLPTVLQALIFISSVKVDTTLLIAMIGASVIGSWFGAGLVSRLPGRKIQLGMGIALLVASILFCMKNLDLLPGGGEDLVLDGWRFWFSIGGMLVLGALMMFGIGLYAPCLIMVSLLGMNPLAAFPIMMGSCAIMMPTAGLRFIKSGRFNLRFALGLTLGGIPGVLIAAYLVKSLPLETLRWLVTIVVFYTAIVMIRAWLRDENISAGKDKTILHEIS